MYLLRKSSASSRSCRRGDLDALSVLSMFDCFVLGLRATEENGGGAWHQREDAELRCGEEPMVSRAERGSLAARGGSSCRRRRWPDGGRASRRGGPGVQGRGRAGAEAGSAPARSRLGGGEGRWGSGRR